ncbi:MAG: DUF4139 domain-containing protein [Sandaracinus sp.]|nr:DUF4139 domain-containing protein [Sandaracinus sp.]
MSERRRVEVPVVGARVLEDRAFVRRRAELSLEAGPARLRIDAVAPVIVDKTLEVRLVGAKLGAARVCREYVVERDFPTWRAEVHAAVRTATRAVRELDDRHAATTAELASLEATRALLLTELAEDVAWGRGVSTTAKDQLERTVAREEALRVALADLQPRRRLAHRELADAEDRARQDPHPNRAAWIEIDLECESEGVVAIEVAYLVPSVAWRPRHRATLREGKLELETEAFVWQRTGEDWNDVELSFSTERPSLGVDPPTLETDRLAVRRKPERVEVETRAQAVATTGLGRGEVVAPEVPGVDDGGETQELVADGRVRVPSDGRPHRTTVGCASTEATVDRILASPSPFVLIRARATHPGPRPLLAGPVELVGEHGPLGTSELRYVAPGDRFELSFGPEAAVRVTREEERLGAESKILSSWVRTTTVVKNKLSHVGDEAVRFELVERVPVSEIADVKVELEDEGTTPGATVDDDGFVRWQVALSPGGTSTIELRWTLAKKDHVQGV